MKYKPFSILAKQYKMFPSSFSRYQTNKQNDSIFQKKQFPLKQTVNLNNLISKYQKKKKKSLIFLKPNVFFLHVEKCSHGTAVRYSLNHTIMILYNCLPHNFC